MASAAASSAAFTASSTAGGLVAAASAAPALGPIATRAARDLVTHLAALASSAPGGTPAVLAATALLATIGAALLTSVLVALAWVASASAARSRRDRELRAAAARHRAEEDNSGRWIQAEVVSTQWANLLARHLWPTFVEEEASASLAKTVQSSLTKAHAKLPQWMRNVVSGIALEEMTLGAAAPTLGPLTALYDGNERYLRLEGTLEFVSRGAQMLLLSLIHI